MKRFFKHHIALLLTGACLMSGGFMQAQNLNPEYLDDQFLTISGYLDQGESEDGLLLVDLILDAFGPTSLHQLGPSFGRFFYLKGLFLLAEERYEEAAENFAICHTNFANRGALSQTNPNAFIDEAVVRHITCLMALERYEDAAPLFNKVNPSGLENISDIWAWSLNRGLAMIFTGREQEGVDYLQGILENTDNPNITPSMRMEVIQLLVYHWSDRATLDELRSFVETFRSFYIAAPPSDRRVANPVFLGAARRAYDKADLERSLLWLGFFDYAEAKANAEATPADTSPRSESEELLANALAMTAAVYLQLENPLGAIPAFEALTQQFPEHEQAAEYRYNLALSQISAGLFQEALSVARGFRVDFPDSPLVSEMDSTLLQLLLMMGDLDAAISTAQSILGEEASESAKEMATYALGIALYQQERISRAEATLDAYVSRFPEGENREQVLYYLAACKFQLRRFDEAAQILEDFLRTYRNRPLTSAALLMQAQVFMQNGKNDEAIARLQKIGDEYPDSPEAATAMILAADLKTSSGAPYQEVRLAYEQSLRSARAAQDSAGEREALKKLTLLAADAKDIARSFEYFAQFFEETDPGPADALDVLDATWKQLGEAGYRPVLLARIQTLLLENGDHPHSPVLVPLVDIYRRVLGQRPADFSPLVTLSEASDTPTPLRATLLVAHIDSLKKEDEAKRYELYTQLANQVSREHMSSYVITRLARWYQQRGDQGKAAELRDYLLKTRSGHSGFEYVLFDEALIQAASDNPDIRDAALENFEQVLTRTDDPELLERARLGIARIYSRNQQWKNAEEAWGGYLSNRDWVLARAEANFEFARSIEEGGNPRKALGYYVSIYSNFEKQIDWSAPSYLRAALIMDANGKRREALLILQDMMRRMHQVDHPVVDRAKKLFTQWRNEFIQQP